MNHKIQALAKALASTTVLLYIVLVFGGLFSNMFFPVWGHVSFAMAEFCFLTIILYHEIVAADAVDQANQQKLVDAQASIKQYSKY